MPAANHSTMRRALPALILLGSLSALVGFSPAQAVTTCAQTTRCIDVVVDTTGLGLVGGHARILLPTGYNDAANATKEYPVLYLLHGAGDTYKTWSENTDVIDFTAAYDLIVVMPDGGCQPSPSKPWCLGAGWYSDWVDGSRKYETLHIDRLIPYIDTTYRTKEQPAHRAVAGLSMGGFGAMSYAARHPGRFAAAASFSGLLDTWYGAPLTGLFYDEFSGTISDGVWGDQVTGAPTWWEHDPAMIAGGLAGTALWLASGTGEPTPGASLPFDVGENLIFQTNMSFVRALATAARLPEVHYATNFYPGGRHAWPYWQAALHWALPEILAVIG